MSTSVTNEQSFEWQIEKALVGSTREERGESADVAAQGADNQIRTAFSQLALAT